MKCNNFSSTNRIFALCFDLQPSHILVCGERILDCLLYGRTMIYISSPTRQARLSFIFSFPLLGYKAIIAIKMKYLSPSILQKRAKRDDVADMDRSKPSFQNAAQSAPLYYYFATLFSSSRPPPKFQFRFNRFYQLNWIRSGPFS